ncbi:MAG: glutathione S-transferase family protein [Pseudomonadota bacterium]
MTTERYQLYAVEGSYYAAKARSCLLRKGIAFEEIRADRRAFEEVIVPRVGYPIIPVVVTPSGETLQDTTAIFDFLEATHQEIALLPASPVTRFACYLVEFLADEWLKIPALHYRWYYDRAFAERMMGENNDPDAPLEQQLRVGAKIATLFRSWPAHLGVSEATRNAVEADLCALLEALDVHFALYPFVMGTSASLADCALMGPVYAHLFHDPYSGAIVRDKAPKVCDWIERMRTSVEAVEDQLTDEAIPDSLMNVLGLIARDAVPAMCEAMPKLQSWLVAYDDRDELPRYAGDYLITLGRGTAAEASARRSIQPFEQWKLQRLQASFVSADQTGRKNIRSFATLIGAAPLLDIELPLQIKRENFVLRKA